MIYYGGMADNAGFGNVELPEGFSEKELRMSSWWVEHRERIRTMALVVFGIIDAIFIIRGLWGITDWLLISGAKESRNVRLIASSAYAQAPQISPVQEIKTDSPLVFTGTSNHYDIVNAVTNPNDWYLVTFQYQFDLGNGNFTPLHNGFIMPGETKRIVELGVKSDASLGSVQMKILKRSFQHIDRHSISDVSAFEAAHLNMPALDSKFIAATPGATLPTSETTFTLVNQTAFSYYDVPFNVFVYRGDALIGASRVVFNTFKAGDKKPVDLFWYQTLNNVTRIEAVPDLNIFDPNVYKTPGA